MKRFLKDYGKAWQLLPIEGKLLIILAYILAGILYWASTVSSLDPSIILTARLNAYVLFCMITAMLAFALALIAFTLERTGKDEISTSELKKQIEDKIEAS